MRMRDELSLKEFSSIALPDASFGVMPPATKPSHSLSVNRTWMQSQERVRMSMKKEMPFRFALRIALLVLPLLGMPLVPANAQPPQSAEAHAELFHTIAALDSGLFDAYNHCNLEKFAG